MKHFSLANESFLLSPAQCSTIPIVECTLFRMHRAIAHCPQSGVSWVQERLRASRCGTWWWSPSCGAPSRPTASSQRSTVRSRSGCRRSSTSSWSRRSSPFSIGTFDSVFYGIWYSTITLFILTTLIITFSTPIQVSFIANQNYLVIYSFLIF